MDHRRIIRSSARRETRQYAAILAHEELLEIPGDVPRKLRALARQQTVQLVTVMAVDLQLAAQRKAHAIVQVAECLDLRLGVRLLPGKLVARQAQHAEALGLVLLIEVL